MYKINYTSFHQISKPKPGSSIDPYQICSDIVKNRELHILMNVTLKIHKPTYM